MHGSPNKKAKRREHVPKPATDTSHGDNFNMESCTSYSNPPIPTKHKSTTKPLYCKCKKGRCKKCEQCKHCECHCNGPPSKGRRNCGRPPKNMLVNRSTTELSIHKSSIRSKILRGPQNTTEFTAIIRSTIFLRNHQ